jgi:hypothetical protein
VHQPLVVGARVGIGFRASRMNVFDAETGKSLPLN